MSWHYFPDDEVLDYIIDAVRLVARDGWRLFGEYRFFPDTGPWRHRRGPVEPPLRLNDIRFTEDGTMTWPRHETIAPPDALASYLEQAVRILAEADPDLGGDANQGDLLHGLRWFMLPQACLTL